MTPSFNQGEYIEETIRSVLLQGYPNLEYVIIDGGSTDATVDIIRKYEPWLTYWVSERDAGQTSAINKGFRRAAGDVLAYLNSDDVYEPGTLLEVGTRFLSGVDFVYGGYGEIDENGTLTRDVAARGWDLSSLMLGNYIAQQTVFFSRRVYECVGALNERYHYVMDYDYWVRVAMAGFVLTSVPRRLARFRRHARSKTTVAEAGFCMEILDMFEKLYGCPDVPDAMRKIAHRARARAHWNAARSAVAVADMNRARDLLHSGIPHYVETPHPDELHIALSFLIKNRQGALLPPAQVKRNITQFKLNSHKNREFVACVEDEYVKAWIASPEGRGTHAAGHLLRAVMVQPRWVLHWGLRRALLNRLFRRHG